MLKIIRIQILMFASFIVFATAPAFSQDHKMNHMHNAEKSAHAHGKPIMLPQSANAPAVSFTLVKDAISGWNLQVKTENFKFAPANASGSHVDGEGHAHLYANGKKIARLYGHWYHIGDLPSGKVDIKVSLNTNDHRGIMVGGKLIEAVKSITNVMKPPLHN